MKDLIIECKGIKTDQYFIPPFELREGEFVVVCLYSGPCFDEIKKQLTDILTGRVHRKNVKIYKHLTFAEPFAESFFRRIFYPVTVGSYLKKNADVNNPIVSKIFEIDTFTKKDKMKNLETSQKKRISLSAVFSRTKNIVFDMRGEGALQFTKTLELVKDEIKSEGAAILIDWVADLRNDCSKFIAIEWLLDDEELRKIRNGSVKLSQMY
ncbi:hypothetical protein [Flavobacterium sp. KMS]|uniref:hypothetical protein n=1 Tax=Flavobacterium sp. KMS TaxID=1566023 RepID=UPI000AE8E2BE|nr:hypothetical protein [Flavobacterium sp. KMS]